MELPNYFLADLGPEAQLTSGILTEACRTLKANQERFLAARTTSSIIKLLTEVGLSWMEPEGRFRTLALHHGPAATGFSRATLTQGLDWFFGGFTGEEFQVLLEQDLGHTERLNRFCASSPEVRAGRCSIARGPHLLAHICAGTLPNPTLMSLVLGLLSRSAQFVKCASGTSFIPRLFAHSLYDADPKIGACIEIAEWRGGNQALENALFEEADCITATGTDEVIASLRLRVAPKARFLPYAHKVSFAYVSGEVLSAAGMRACLTRAVDDIVSWDQLGCLSPHVIYVQQSATASPELFAQMLADALEEREQVQPRGGVSREVSAHITSRRSVYELRAAHGPETRLWCSKGSTAWTVVYETDARFQMSCLHRFIYVKPVKDLLQALQEADPVRAAVSTVGLGAPAHRVQELSLQLSNWGTPRVCALGQMQRPPLSWRHDGRPSLGDLVMWTDLESPLES